MFQVHQRLGMCCFGLATEVLKQAAPITQSVCDQPVISRPRGVNWPHCLNRLLILINSRLKEGDTKISLIGKSGSLAFSVIGKCEAALPSEGDGRRKTAV